MEIVDSHQHFWQLDRNDYAWLTPQQETLYRDYLPQHYLEASTAQPATQSVLVQAASTDAETDFILQLAQSHKFVTGVVAWLDFSAKNARQRLIQLAANPYVKGVRPMLQDIQDSQWILNPDFAPIFTLLIEKQLCFDALIQMRHLNVMDQLAKHYPQLKIIIDHCAKPAIGKSDNTLWLAGMQPLAKHNNMVVKFSGLTTEAQPQHQSAQDYQCYFTGLLHTFGCQRILWGSDWPVVNLNSSYHRWFSICQTLSQELSRQQQQDFWANNAKRIYGLAANNK